MRARQHLLRLLRDEAGAAAEFALVLPIAALFLFGIIDAGMYAWTFNKGEKATQIGARWAVVTDPLTPQLATQSYVGTTVGGVTVTQGDRIPAGALGEISCNSTSCTCAVAPCPANMTLNNTAFTNLVTRMQDIMPEIETTDLVVEYSGSGLGYAGNPNGMDIAPFVTVRLEGMDFSSILLFGNTIGLPDFSYTLTMEDGSGTGSN